jgi:hypothetical protein
MKLDSISLSGLVLGGAAWLLAPADSLAFTKIGGSLNLDQRDFRVFDNFVDSQSNNNTTPDSQFPGQTGAEMAIWKGIIEWQSGAHGTGGGDPTQAILGSGNANYDPAWGGRANAVGGTDDNIHSATSTGCGGGVLAFTETPINNGWRIRYCDSQWIWEDGPGSIGGGNFDLQAVACHEQGHALGLGHSNAGNATMFPSVSSGSTALRSIEADDIAGIQCIYGVKSASKPLITAATFANRVVTITGSNFAATGNEVWFTRGGVSAPSTDPRVRVFNASSTGGGTQIVVNAPFEAAQGDILVRAPGTAHDRLSNAFPLGSN